MRSFLNPLTGKVIPKNQPQINGKFIFLVSWGLLGGNFERILIDFGKENVGMLELK